MATTSIRTIVRDELIDRLNAQQQLVTSDGRRVPVDPGDPGDKQEREHVWVETIAGTREVAFLEAGRKTIDDQFTITFVFAVMNPGATVHDATGRAEQMGYALEDVLADDPSLGDLDGLVWAKAGRWDGPVHFLIPDGAMSVVMADVDCRARAE
jgi:hypothetical protein